jgi:rubrerythrin
MADSIQDAVQKARKMEMDGIDFYSKLAEKCASEAGKTLFTSFTDDEKRHLRVIKEIAKGLGVDTHKLSMPRDTIRTIFADAAGKVDDYAEATQDEKDAIGVAMGMETKSYQLYSEAAKSAKDRPMRELFERLAEQENQHYEMLENTLEYLNSNDAWFLWKEGGLLTGDMSSLSE